jgi:hypothetical protein
MSFQERNPLPQQTIEGMRHGDFRTSSAANSSWHKALGERNNQVTRPEAAGGRLKALTTTKLDLYHHRA